MKRVSRLGVLRAAFGLLFLQVACGPGGVYCQGGPKHGTTCYAPADVHAEQRNQGRLPAPDDWTQKVRRSPPPPARISSASRGAAPSGRSATVQLARASSADPNGEVEARRYAVRLAEWLEEHWLASASSGQLPCALTRPLQIGVKIRVTGDGRVHSGEITEPSGDPELEAAVERALGALVDRPIPEPPALHRELLPRAFDARLNNQGVPCGSAPSVSAHLLRFSVASSGTSAARAP